MWRPFHIPINTPLPRHTRIHGTIQSYQHHHMKIPQTSAKSLLSFKRANEVTSLSKILAAVLFVMMPFIGFAIGFTEAGGILPIGW